MSSCSVSVITRDILSRVSTYLYFSFSVSLINLLSFLNNSDISLTAAFRVSSEVISEIYASRSPRFFSSWYLSFVIPLIVSLSFPNVFLYVSSFFSSSCSFYSSRSYISYLVFRTFSLLCSITFKISCSCLSITLSKNLTISFHSISRIIAWSAALIPRRLRTRSRTKRDRNRMRSS
jgi:hypothetical protein